jgi:excisionase family DNA binding protein
MSESSEMLTLEEVSKKYRLKPGTIYAMVREKRIPHTKFGRLLRFPVKLMAKWESQRTFIPKSMNA